MPRETKRVQMNQAKLFLGDTGAFDDLTNLTQVIGSAEQLGLSEDGLTASFEIEKASIPFAGSLGRDIKNNEFIVSWKGSVEGTVIAFTDALMEASLFTKAQTTTELQQFKPAEAKLIEAGMYKDLLMLGTTVEGKYIVIVLKDTYNENFTFETKDKDTCKSKVKFTTHYADIDNNEPPFRIYMPKTTA